MRIAERRFDPAPCDPRIDELIDGDHANGRDIFEPPQDSRGIPARMESILFDGTFGTGRHRDCFALARSTL